MSNLGATCGTVRIADRRRNEMRVAPSSQPCPHLPPGRPLHPACWNRLISPEPAAAWLHLGIYSPDAATATDNAMEQPFVQVERGEHAAPHPKERRICCAGGVLDARDAWIARAGSLLLARHAASTRVRHPRASYSGGQARAF